MPVPLLTHFFGQLLVTLALPIHVRWRQFTNRPPSPPSLISRPHPSSPGAVQQADVLVVDLSLPEEEVVQLIRTACTGPGFFYGASEALSNPQDSCCCLPVGQKWLCQGSCSFWQGD